MKELVEDYLNKLDGDIEYFKRAIKILKNLNDELVEENERLKENNDNMQQELYRLWIKEKGVE